MTTNAVRIRIGNRSQVDFERVVVKFPSQTEDFGRVPAAGQSEYRQIAKAYRYAAIEVTIGSAVVALRPIDYVGEEPLAPADYTYALAVDSTPGSPGRLELTLIRD